MIRSSESLMAQDVTFRCRVRRIALGQNPDHAETQSMICTMRNWEKHQRSESRSRAIRQSFSLANPLEQQNRTKTPEKTYNGPELMFTPIAEYISTRDDSPVRSLSRQKVSPKPSHPVQFVIPISDISTVNTCGHRLSIATLSMGLFELDHLTNNAFDILLAFLQNCLRKDRIYICDDPTTHNETLRSTSSVTSCLDIDALQAQQLRNRAELETWPEKLSRRVGHVVNSLSEFTSSFCDAACCRDTLDNQREVPEKSHRYQELEIDNNTTDTPRRALEKHIHNLPSGLSVEESESKLDAAQS